MTVRHKTRLQFDTEEFRRKIAKVFNDAYKKLFERAIQDENNPLREAMNHFPMFPKGKPYVNVRWIKGRGGGGPDADPEEYITKEQRIRKKKKGNEEEEEEEDDFIESD